MKTNVLEKKRDFESKIRMACVVCILFYLQFPQPQHAIVYTKNYLCLQVRVRVRLLRFLKFFHLFSLQVLFFSFQISFLFLILILFLSPGARIHFISFFSLCVNLWNENHIVVIARPQYVSVFVVMPNFSAAHYVQIKYAQI